MIDDEILSYTKQKLQEGVSKEAIKKSLLESGWQDSDIDGAISVVLSAPDFNKNSINIDNKNELVSKFKERRYILKVILYGLLGLTGFLGFILGGLWIKFKTKINKRSKFIALLVGILLSFIIPYLSLAYIHTKYPETKKIENTINDKYTNGSATAGINWNKSWKSGEEAITTSTLVIGYKSKEFISADDMLSMGRNACLILNEENKDYDVVGLVNSISPIYPLSIPFYSYYFNFSGTCEDWIDNEEFEQSIKSLRSRF